MARRTVRARVLHGGTAEGEALVLAQPLSLWGGLDPDTGRLVDAHHPQRGAELAGRVLLMPAGRGSSSSSSVLAEAVRAGTAPVAILLGEADLILAIGAEVASALYGRDLPVLVLDADAMGSVLDGEKVSILEGGAVVFGG